MRNDSHTFISIIREHLDDWRQVNGWSRESLAMELVDAHTRIGNDKPSRIKFDPDTRDAYQRLKVNADRIFRWLDDITKDNNQLPVNFTPAIVAALPIDRRVRLLSDLYAVYGVSVSAKPTEDSVLDAVSILKSVLKEGSEANNSIASLIDGATKKELIYAQREMKEAILAMQNGLVAIDSAISKSD